MQHASDSANPWHAGPFKGAARGLLFGVMYEDPSLEINAFAPASRVFCIASAGCTARALSARGHEVTAVDINPQQILYSEARAAGAPMREGVAERFLSRARALFPIVGWSDAWLREFLSLRDPSEQLHYWHSKLNTKRYRAAVDTFLSASLLRLVYRNPFLTSLPRPFGPAIRARLERTWKNHSNDSNPYAWRLLLGETRSVPQPATHAIRFACEDVATYLENCKPATFDAFSLSNIADGASPFYVRRLCRAVRRAATPGAVVVTRSFAEASTAVYKNFAARDRSMIWGSVHVVEARDLCSTF